MLCAACLSSLIPENLSSVFWTQSAIAAGDHLYQLMADITNSKQSLKKTLITKVSLENTSKDGWIVLVNQLPVLKSPNFMESIAVATRLQLLLQTPTLDPNQIQPVQINGRYQAMLGFEPLFTVSENEDTISNPSLTLIQWVNNLRIALGGEPLTLLEAQETMYNLVPTEQNLQGLASWYGPYFQGRLTASGEIFEQQDFTAAHPNLPFNTYLKVTNLQNGNSVVVRINDRGPYVKPRMLDLSYAAATYLDSEHTGVVPIEATVMQKN